MIGVFAGAMTTVMALVLFSTVLPLGAVDPVLASGSVLLTSFLVLLWVARLFLDKEAVWFCPLTHWGVAAFIAYAAFRYSHSPLEYEARAELLQLLQCGLAYFIASNQFTTRRDRNVLIGTLMLIGLFQSGYAMWQAFTRSDSIFHWERPEQYNGRGSGTFVCPNHLAGFLEMCLGLIIARAAILRRENSSINLAAILKIVTIYVAIVIVVGILVTFSRAGWASSIAGLIALLFLGGWRNRRALPKIAVALSLLVCTVLFLWFFKPTRNYLLNSLKFDSKSDAVTLSDPTIGGRTMMWHGTIGIIRDHPVFGTGIGTWQWEFPKYKDYRILSVPDYAHNDYLQLASDYGLVGFVLALLIFVSFFHHVQRIITTSKSSEHRAFAVGAAVSVISILVHSWFDFNMHIPANSLLLAVIMGYTAAINPAASDKKPVPMRWWQRYLAATSAMLVCGYLVVQFVPTALAFHHTRSGNSFKADLEYITAVSHLEQAIKLDGKYPTPYVKLGDIYRDQATWRLGPGKQAERRALAEKAVERYSQSLRLNPAQTDVWLSKARSYEMLGDRDSALASYQKAIEVAPVSPYAHFLLGQFYKEHGEEQKAVESFQKAHLYYFYNEPLFLFNALDLEEKIKSRVQPEQQR